MIITSEKAREYLNDALGKDEVHEQLDHLVQEAISRKESFASIQIDKAIAHIVGDALREAGYQPSYVQLGEEVLFAWQW